MTTKQAAKIAKELLSDLPGFVAWKTMVFKSPIDDDFLRALYFENTSDANYFNFHVFLMPLFVPHDYISFSYGDRIGNAPNWRLDNPDLVANLRAAIHAEGIPFLNKVSKAAGIIEYLKADIEGDRQRVNPHTLEALAYTLIRSGDYSSALKALGELSQMFGKSTTSWVLQVVARGKAVEEKLLLNPELALAQLDEWKAETVTNIGLEKYCDRSGGPLSGTAS